MYEEDQRLQFFLPSKEIESVVTICCVCSRQISGSSQLFNSKQNDSGARWPSSDDFSGAGGLGGEDQTPDSTARKQSQSASRRVMAYDMAMKAAASPSSASAAPLAGGDVGDINNKMNGSRPDPYVILNLGSFVRRVPFQRLAVWASVALVMFQLRDFVGVCISGSELHSRSSYHSL